MFDQIFQRSKDVLNLRDAWIIYIVILLVFCIVSLLTILIQTVFLSLIAYVACGIYLNRIVLRRIIVWHPVYNTVENVFKGKLYMLFLWPISYPILLLKLAVDKYF